MATLNTLRTRFGVILSVIIALALLAFILSLKTEMGFSDRDPQVGEIAGKKVNYSEYYNQYEQVRARSGMTESSEEEAAALADATWQTLFTNRVLTPGFEKMGLAVSEPERLAMISGEYPTQAFYSAFADANGNYDMEIVNEFLVQSESNPQARQMWAALNTQARMEREIGKYLGLIKGGVYVNKLEVASGVDAANRKASGRWISKKYTSVPDSLFEITGNEIKAYYNAHKEAFKQTPSISLSYVVFNVDPTDDDMLAIENEARATGADFAATEDVKGFARANRYGSITPNYLSSLQLPSDEVDALMNGQLYGPELKNNLWTMSRVVDAKMVPDSIGVRHIVLPYTAEALADSLLVALRGGADFAAAAAEHSLYAATAQNGGEVGVLPFSAFSEEFVDALATAKAGDIVKIQVGDAIQLMQVYRADKPSKHVQVATIAYPLEASAATRRNVHNEAGSFTVAAKGSVEGFNEAASAMTVLPATITRGDRTLRGLENSRDIVRWAYSAKKGDVSEIFKVGKDYVVAVVTDIDNNEYASVNKVASQIRPRLLRSKRFEYIKNLLSGSTLEEQAASLGSEIGEFEEVGFGSYYVNGLGFEPRVVGAISVAEKGAVSPLIEGLTGAYVFVVDDVTVGIHQKPEAERVRMQANNETMAQQRAIPAVQEMANIKDLRGKYF